jgi:hypothetical protein
MLCFRRSRTIHSKMSPIAKKARQSNEMKESLSSLSKIVNQNSDNIEALSALPSMITAQAEALKQLTDAVYSLKQPTAFAEGTEMTNESVDQRTGDPIVDLLSSVAGKI